MGTVVCQGLQSYLDSQLAESRTLWLRLSSPKPHYSQSLELALKHCLSESNNPKEPNDKCHYEKFSNKAHSFHDKHAPPNPDSGGWSFLQALSNSSSQGLKELAEKESMYVHPLVKRSSSTLSEKSLELCTEKLGSETGTDTVENSVDFLWSSLDSSSSEEEEAENSPAREQPKPRGQLLGAKKAKSSCFPPPLTTMSGSEPLRVRSHREDGRLVIKAVKAPSLHTYFQAERSQGRLRLCLVEDSAPNFDSMDVASTEENARRSDGDNEKVEMENDTNHDKVREEEEEREQEEKREVFEEADCEVVTDDNELDGASKEGDDIEKAATLLNLEPFRVAIF